MYKKRVKGLEGEEVKNEWAVSRLDPSGGKFVLPLLL
jgi:hypothetical protein